MRAIAAAADSALTRLAEHRTTGIDQTAGRQQPAAKNRPLKMGGSLRGSTMAHTLPIMEPALHTFAASAGAGVAMTRLSGTQTPKFAGYYKAADSSENTDTRRVAKGTPGCES